MSSLKIFVVYHKRMPMFRSDCFEPIQTGCAINKPLPDFLHDDSGDNVSGLNPYFAELTGGYWVWKNYLPMHPDLKYVGFCHYRRFIDFGSAPKGKTLFPDRRSYEWMEEHLRTKFAESKILSVIEPYDVVLPNRIKLGVFRFGITSPTMLLQYLNCGHSKIVLEDFCKCIVRRNPDYGVDVDCFLNGNVGFLCLNYVMRREVFCDYMQWVFDILDGMGGLDYWRQFDHLPDRRVAALAIERLMNVWLNHQVRTRKLRLLERNGILLDYASELTFRKRILRKYQWSVVVLKSAYDFLLRRTHKVAVTAR